VLSTENVNKRVDAKEP